MTAVDDGLPAATQRVRDVLEFYVICNSATRDAAAEAVARAAREDVADVRNRCRDAAELLSALPNLLLVARADRGLSRRAAAQEIGVGHVTLHKIEHGGNPTAAIAARILQWLTDERCAEVTRKDRRTEGLACCRGED